MVVINSGINLTVANNTAINDFLVSGTLVNAGNIITNGRLTFANGGVYEHAYTTSSGSVPTATWENGSDCRITGITTSTSAVLFPDNNPSFYNFIWNCSNQDINSLPALPFNFSVRNNFEIVSTGASILRTTATTTSRTFFVKNYIQTGGVVDMSFNGSLSNVGTVFNISGNFIFTGGIIRKSSTNINNRGRFVFNGNATQIFQKEVSAQLNNEIDFVINVNTIIDFGTSVLNGTSGNFNLNNGATLITAHPDGITSSGATGIIQNTGSRSFSTGANYTYNGNVPQQAGTGLPATVNNLTINNAAGVTMRSGALAVNGNLAIQNGFLDMRTNALTVAAINGFIGTGTLRTQNTSANPISAGKTWSGTVEFNAGTSQTIVSGTFNNLTASTGGTKTISGAANVSNTLTVNSPAVLNANGNLTLLATATNNANLAALSGSADIIGNVNVQSFISGAANAGFRGTRSMSSPVNDAAIIGARTFEQLKNYMIVTGSGGVANGFDAVPNGVSNSTILFTYNNILSSPFVPITNITTPLASGSGFMYFFMGNRNNKDSNPGKLIPPFVSPENVTLTYTGPVNKGNIDIPINYNASKTSMQGAFIAGNPYPATIDWNAVQASSANIGSTITVVVGGKPNATYNAALGLGTNGGSRYIQPGQGFYVYAGVGGGILRFRETHKNISEAPARLLATKERYFLQSATGGGTGSFSRTSSDNTNTRALRMALESGQMVEETLVAFGEGFNAIADEQDSRYITGYDVNLATLSADKKPLAINLLPEGQTELALSVNSRASGNMKLRFTDLPNISGMQMMLKDHYLNVTVPISDVNSAYEFAIQKNIAASFGDQRFTLAFAPITTLPLTFVDFKVNKVQQTAELSWSTADEVYNDFFEVERSTDGKTFLVVKRVEPQPSTGAFNNYKSVDDKPFRGVNYYRIKQTDKDGTHSFSKLQSIDFSDLRATTTDAAIQIYPNPTENYLFLSTIKKDSQAVNLRIIDMNGVVKKSFVFKTEDEIKLNVEDLDSGLYMVEMLNTSSEERIGTAKFIKK
ncbi:T9SS type A sorting domain-containing protein [Pedobacter aquae]|uniref:T9SS type A sorting domain-containing protein n=1 Tax=Pedobacter aquae TaxID=2605747 RepID=A0A5C0VEU7_9SPHI|nr:T9SS type A sorting domain-containing protein [Pedobacter aquae]QEK50363.1 T9SS type A sorting domain-containing protein [Pedobacter aquae]